MSFIAKRQERLRALLQSEELDAFFISNPVNVTWLSGFSGDSSFLIVGQERTLIVSDTRYTEQIEQERPGAYAHIRTVRQSPVA